MSSPKRTHGPGLRFAREHLGWSLAALADKAEISKTHLFEVERGTRDLSPGKLRHLAEVLNVPLGLLTSASFPHDWETFADEEGDVA